MTASKLKYSIVNCFIIACLITTKLVSIFCRLQPFHQFYLFIIIAFDVLFAKVEILTIRIRKLVLFFADYHCLRSLILMLKARVLLKQRFELWLYSYFKLWSASVKQKRKIKPFRQEIPSPANVTENRYSRIDDRLNPNFNYTRLETNPKMIRLGSGSQWNLWNLWKNMIFQQNSSKTATFIDYFGCTPPPSPHNFMS